jgi:hypothetical protein
VKIFAQPTLNKYYLDKSRIFFEDLLSYKVSGAYIKCS